MKKNLLFLLFLFLSEIIFSQRAIVLTSPEKKDTWIINVGDIMRYELKSDPYGMYIGEVMDIKDSSVIVSNEEIRLSAIRMIKISRKHARKSLMLGIFLGGMGAAAPSVNNAAGGVLSNDIVTITQVAFIGTAAYFIIKGIVELAVPHKCYLDAGWKVRTVLSATLKE